MAAETTPPRNAQSTRLGHQLGVHGMAPLPLSLPLPVSAIKAPKAPEQDVAGAAGAAGGDGAAVSGGGAVISAAEQPKRSPVLSAMQYAGIRVEGSGRAQQSQGAGRSAANKAQTGPESQMTSFAL